MKFLNVTSKTIGAAIVLGAVLPANPVQAQVAGDKASNLESVLRLSAANRPQGWSVAQIGSSLGCNLLHTREEITLTFRLTNTLNQPLDTAARVDVIPYITSVAPGDLWVPVAAGAPGLEESHLSIPIHVDAKGSANFEVTPKLPAQFATCALVLDLGAKGRALAASVSRVVTPDEGAVPYPACSLDLPRNITPSSMTFFKRLGAKASRMEIGPFDTAAPDAAAKWADLDAKFALMRANDVTVMLTVDNGNLAQPTGKGRPLLDDNGIQRTGKFDDVWLPSEDTKFAEWIRQMAVRYGYPKGPINAMELWNEPWEGISISGWGADMLRYREIYKAMAGGLAQARREAGVQILQGGASSSSNTLDKLFPDGSNEFLPLLDFTSIHYQMMAAAPALIPAFRNRKPAPVQTWDTETWVANSGDRIPAIIASMRAMGQDRVLGVFYGNVYADQMLRADGKIYDATQAWTGAPACAAAYKFIGNRDFKGLLFPSGLPWVFEFRGAPQSAEKPERDLEQGTLVLVGDLSGAYDPNSLPLRDVVGLKNVEPISAAEKAYAELPADADRKTREEAETARRAARLLRGASLTIADPEGKFRLFDSDGNLVSGKRGALAVPLNGLGYYLRTDGSPGAFAALKKAVSQGQIEGYQPLHVATHDFTSPLSAKPDLRLELTNILNRPLKGTLKVGVEGVRLDEPTRTVSFAAGETKMVSFAVTAGTTNPANSYALTVSFDAGRDGALTRRENLHCNVISHRPITVDGDLKDWDGVLPQSAGGTGIAASETEKAWLPFLNFDTGAAGVSRAYLAADKDYLYFAAKIADNSPDEGTVNFLKREDSDYFYPPTAFALNTATSLGKRDVVATMNLDRPRALQSPDGEKRVLGFYETTTTKSFAVDVDPGAGGPRQVALYFADNLEPGRRKQVVELEDETGKTVDSRQIKGFDGGLYLVYNLSRKSRFKITSLSSPAVLNAVFFDAAAPNAGAGFVRQDDVTAGLWRGKYGTQGYHFAALGLEKLPAGVSLTVPQVLDTVPVVWPEGVRRYSYRKLPVLPFNTGDDVQIAFNVLPDDQKPWYLNPPGVPPKWMVYPDTDYEYSLSQVSPANGGGTQIWRLLAPGMPRKHFYPRQPVWPGNGIHSEGTVLTGKLVMKRDDTTRVVELALPWAEIPEIKTAMEAGRTVKFTYRVGDNTGQPYELAQNRSVSKVNFYTFHPDFNTHWANELEFGWEK